jgi:hypothetical protein
LVYSGRRNSRQDRIAIGDGIRQLFEKNESHTLSTAISTGIIVEGLTLACVTDEATG